MDAIQQRFFVQDRMIRFFKEAMELSLVFIINEKVKNFQVKRIKIDRQNMRNNIFGDAYSCQFSIRISYNHVDLDLCFAGFMLCEQENGVFYFSVEKLRDRIISMIEDHIKAVLSIKDAIH